MRYQSHKIEIKFKGVNSLLKYSKPLYEDFIQYFILNSSGIQYTKIKKITINFKTLKKNEIGHVSSGKINPSNIEVTIDKKASALFTLKYIAHELTHINQIIEGDLVIVMPKTEEPYFIWKQNQRYTLSYYNDLVKHSKIDEYKQLPWEQEAYLNQEKFPEMYFASEKFRDLVRYTTEPNLQFILNHIKSI